jgi:hypothetical protein
MTLPSVTNGNRMLLEADRVGGGCLPAVVMAMNAPPAAMGASVEATQVPDVISAVQEVTGVRQDKSANMRVHVVFS